MRALLRKLSPIRANGLSRSMPIYVTRPHGSRGVTASYEITLWQSLLVILLVWGNIVVWSIIGLIKAFSILF